MYKEERCIFCGEMYKNKQLPKEYTINGRGKFRTITYFHRDCYYENTIGAKNKNG